MKSYEMLENFRYNIQSVEDVHKYSITKHTLDIHTIRSQHVRIYMYKWHIHVYTYFKDVCVYVYGGMHACTQTQLLESENCLFQRVHEQGKTPRLQDS